MSASPASSSPDHTDAVSGGQADTSENDLGLTVDAPWLGLRSFTAETRGYFFGRDVEIQALFDRVQHRTLTVLFGQSGLGKTSLLQAGLIPRLREMGYFPIVIRLVHEENSEPLQQQVVNAIADVITSVRLPRSGVPTLWELFHDPKLGLTNSDKIPVLIIDQFEEIFTLGEEKRPKDGREFIEALACVVENRPPVAIRAAMDQDDDLAMRLLLGPQPCRVLLALRDDYLSHLERSRQQMPSLMDNRLELRLLSGQQAFRAVYEPGTKRSTNPIVSRETARAIVRFVAGAKADTPLEEIHTVPPLLSLICEQLNVRRMANFEPTINASSLTQSAPEVLREFYNNCFAPHPPAVREFVEYQLVSSSGYRESKTLDSATSFLSEAGIPLPLTALRQLVDQRLLVVEDRGGLYRIELTHDILAPIAAASRKERAAIRRRAEIQRKRLRVVSGAIVALALAIAAGFFLQSQFARQKKATAALGLVQSLRTAETSTVPEIIKEMTDNRKWIEPLLRRINQVKASTYRERLNISLCRFSLLPPEVTRDDFQYLFDCLIDKNQDPHATPMDFLIIRDTLAPRKDELLKSLWSVAKSADKRLGSQRLHAVSALAKYDQHSLEWKDVPLSISHDLVDAPTAYVSLWMSSLRPVGANFINSLSDIYRNPRHEVARSVATDLLADYAANEPDILKELMLDADLSQFSVIYPKFKPYETQELPALITEIGKTFDEIDKELPPLHREDAKEKQAKRQANAAVILMKMQKPELVWPLLKHSEDPRTRSYLIHRFDALGLDTGAIIEYLKSEPEISIRRALLLCLGEYREDRIAPELREQLLPQFKESYLKDTDPGIHSALEWVLRQWGEEPWLKQTNAEWAGDGTTRVQRVDSIQSTLSEDSESNSPQWYVNSVGTTMVVLPGPVTFSMGSTVLDIAREDDETQHERRIGRTFAIAATPITVKQFQQFDPKHEAADIGASPVDPSDFPAVRITWYEAALFCNWLSEQEGIPPSQWVYRVRKNKEGQPVVTRLRSKYLGLSGYRLPTEAEMEYATRAGAETTRFYGETDELLQEYAWFALNSARQPQPVGRMKPNDFGLFDTHGNVNSWCQETFRDYPKESEEAEETEKEVVDDVEDTLWVKPKEPRMFRGGSYKDDASLVRSAYRNTIAPNESYPYLGFRPARTLAVSRSAH